MDGWMDGDSALHTEETTKEMLGPPGPNSVTYFPYPWASCVLHIGLVLDTGWKEGGEGGRGGGLPRQTPVALSWWHSRLWFSCSYWKDSPVVLRSLLCGVRSPSNLFESPFFHALHGHDNVTSPVGGWEEEEGERWVALPLCS